ncbi:MAG: hypothetical protein R3190_19385, partial [Thermoanaerobaculia bacterium]|nr:hypothetical protein [Thermoanaerobaculia bacterium]
AVHELWGQVAADLTGIVTRRAGVASQQVAESWSTTPHGAALLASGGQSLWRHGHETTTAALEELGGWQVELRSLARDFTRRGRLSERKAAKVERLVWPLVLDPDRTPPRALRRRYRHLVEQVVSTARTRLGDLLTAAVRADAGRFDQFLPEVDVEATERIARLGRDAEAVLDAAAETDDRDA